MGSRHKISLVIPARNEAVSLPMVLAELPMDFLYEIIVVDGHSTDGTPDIVRKLGYEKVKVVVQKGRGFGMGIITGIKMVTGDLVTIFDADGSFDPKGLPMMLEHIKQGNDFVFCSRYMPGSGSDDDTIIRYIGNKFFTFLLRSMFGVKLSDSLYYYSMGKKEIYDWLDLKARDFSLCLEVPIKVHRMGFNYAQVPMRERKRIAGYSKVHAAWDGIRILITMLKLKLTGL